MGQLINALIRYTYFYALSCFSTSTLRKTFLLRSISDFFHNTKRCWSATNQFHTFRRRFHSSLNRLLVSFLFFSSSALSCALHKKSASIGNKSSCSVYLKSRLIRDWLELKIFFSRPNGSTAELILIFSLAAMMFMELASCDVEAKQKKTHTDERRLFISRDLFLSRRHVDAICAEVQKVRRRKLENYFLNTCEILVNWNKWQFLQLLLIR